MGSIAASPDYGHRLIPSLIDTRATETPDSIYCYIPLSADFSAGLRPITWSSFAQAIDKASYWLESAIGKAAPGSFPCFAYIGIHGPLYYVLSTAAMKTGHTILLLSPRNSIAGQVSLLEKTKAQALLKAPSANVGSIRQAVNIRTVQVPELEFFLSDEDEESVKLSAKGKYPFSKTFEEAKWDPICILHSSGSTGLPKPITLTHGSAASIDAHHLLEDVGEYRDMMRALEGTRWFVPMPSFHAAGTMMNFFSPIFFGYEVIYAHPSALVSADLADKALSNIKLTLDGMLLPPSILEDMTRFPETLPKLRRLKYIWFAGGPLTQELGDIINQHVQVVSLLGSTESMIPPYNYQPIKEWNHLLLPTQLPGIEMRDQGDGTYEMVIVREPYTDQFHSTWYTFPEATEYSTKDLFSRNAQNPNLWQHKGRTDDVLVLSNGEKVVPMPMESALRLSPIVKDALVLGHGRFETAAIIELTDEAAKVPAKDNLKAISEFLEQANATSPTHAKLSRDRILFTAPSKPMTRAGKGTVIRKATIASYSSEIAELYEGRSSGELLDVLPLHIDATSTSFTENSLQGLFAALLGIDDASSLSIDTDLFTAGLDSLQVLNAVRQLKQQLRNEHAKLSPDLVSLTLLYSNPSVRKLAKALHNLSTFGKGGRSEEERERSMKEIYMRYASTLPHIEAGEIKPLERPATVLLTGSTGSIGSFLLDLLVRSGDVRRVFAVNRSSNSHERQLRASGSRNLSTELFDTKVTFVAATLDKEMLGLEKSVYEKLVGETDYIVHNAWPVDFNLSLESFEPSIRGTRHLIDLALATPSHTPILFTSTISAVFNFHAGRVPEAPMHDLSIPSATGYGEGKHVSERLLEAASQISGVRTHVTRLGQIAGPVQEGHGGMWNKAEWFPTLVASSAHLGKLPSDIGGLGSLRWVPVDVCAAVLWDFLRGDLWGVQVGDGHVGQVEDAEKDKAELCKFSHVENPNSGNWADVVGSVAKRLEAFNGKTGGKEKVEVVGFEEWLGELRDSAAVERPDPVANPGIKLLDFFEEMGRGVREGVREAELGTERAEGRSGALRGLERVGEGWMGVWLGQWGY